jgi:type I restriction enzyme S subunit
MKGKKKASPQRSNLFDKLELPECWTLTKIRDLVTINYGKGLKDADRAGGNVSVYGSNGIVGSHNKALTDGPSIIIGRKGSIGEVHYSANPSWPIDTTYYIDKFEGIDPTFLAFALKSLNLSDLDTSTAIPGLNRNDIYNQEIPLPSLAEQQRIVARVEALLTQVNAARDRLSRMPLIMKKFRQTVLAAACSGRLTEGWREANISPISSEDFLKQALAFRRKYYTKKSNKTYKEPVTLSEDLPFSLPDEWSWATLDQISQFVTDGDHYPPKRVPTGIPHLTSKHVKKWKLSYEDCSFISHEDYEIVKVRYEPQEGDVILTCVGTIGETAIVPEKSVFSADRNLAAIRLFPEFFLPQMLQFILNSAPWENHIKTVSGSTAQPHIYLKDLRAMAVPLPPLAEQHEIVRRVGRVFKRVDAFDLEVAAAGRRCERLTQAVLGKAFAGRL